VVSPRSSLCVNECGWVFVLWLVALGTWVQGERFLGRDCALGGAGRSLTPFWHDKSLFTNASRSI
jgi:hypothetical protein